MRPRVLWIEDSARLELRNLAAPVYSSGRFDFNLAEDVTSAVNLLKVTTFDAVLVDVRLPPGLDPYWKKLYQHAGADKVNAQLGIKLLHWLIAGDRQIHPDVPPNGFNKNRLGIFTVESRDVIQEELDILGITVFFQKTTSLPDAILIKIFDSLMKTENL